MDLVHDINMENVMLKQQMRDAYTNWTVKKGRREGRENGLFGNILLNCKNPFLKSENHISG